MVRLFWRQLLRCLYKIYICGVVPFFSLFFPRRFFGGGNSNIQKGCEGLRFLGMLTAVDKKAFQVERGKLKIIFTTGSVGKGWPFFTSDY